MTKIIVAGWFSVDPEKRDEVVESYQELGARARKAAGCIDLAISPDLNDPGRINNFEFWDSEQDLDAWRVVALPPKEITPMLTVHVQKHEIQKSGPPF